MKSNKLIAILILITVLLVVPIVSAKTIVSTELVKSQYPAFIAQFGIGDNIYKYMYSDGSTELIYKRQSIFSISTASLTPSNPTGMGDTWIVGESPKIYIDVVGMGTAFDGLSSHVHTVTVTSPNGQSVFVKQATIANYEVLPIVFPLGIMNTPGNYVYSIKETIRVLGTDMNYFTMTGDSTAVTISVINCAASDIQSVILPDPQGVRKRCLVSLPNPTPTSTPTITATPAPTLPVTATIKQGNGAIYILTSSTAYGSRTSVGGTGGAGLTYTKNFYNNDKFGIMAEPSAGYKLLKVCKDIDCSIVVPYYAYISSPATFDIYFDFIPTPTPTVTSTPPNIVYSLSISKPSYLIGETVTINACVDSTGGHLITSRPDGGLMYDWQLPVGKCSVANYPTSSTFMRGTYTVKLTDMSNVVKSQNSFQLLDISTPPSPTIQPPNISSMINAFVSFIKSLFPSLQW